MTPMYSCSPPPGYECTFTPIYPIEAWAIGIGLFLGVVFGLCMIAVLTYKLATR